MSKESKFRKYKDKATEVLKDNDRVNELLAGTRKKISEMLGNNDKLKDFSDKIFLMIRMVKAQISGEYREFPWRSLAMIVGALIYFITPIDMIPDIIPVLGLTDDISIVYWIYKSIQEDIEKFEAWERTIELT